jgi:hypothetical protein
MVDKETGVLKDDIDSLVKDGLLIRRYNDSGDYIGVTITKKGMEYTEEKFAGDPEVEEIKQRRLNR